MGGEGHIGVRTWPWGPSTFWEQEGCWALGCWIKGPRAQGPAGRPCLLRMSLPLSERAGGFQTGGCLGRWALEAGSRGRWTGAVGPPRGPRGTGKWGRCWNRVTVGGSGGNGRKTGVPGWEPRFAGLLRRQTERVPMTPSPLKEHDLWPRDPGLSWVPDRGAWTPWPSPGTPRPRHCPQHNAWWTWIPWWEELSGNPVECFLVPLCFVLN